jgi:hypothetical protein
MNGPPSHPKPSTAAAPKSHPRSPPSTETNFSPPYTVTFQAGQPDVVINPPSTFSHKTKFVIGETEYAWKTDEELVEPQTRKGLAVFDGKMVSMKEKGGVEYLWRWNEYG